MRRQLGRAVPSAFRDERGSSHNLDNFNFCGVVFDIKSEGALSFFSQARYFGPPANDKPHNIPIIPTLLGWFNEEYANFVGPAKFPLSVCTINVNVLSYYRAMPTGDSRYPCFVWRTSAKLLSYRTHSDVIAPTSVLNPSQTLDESGRKILIEIDSHAAWRCSKRQACSMQSRDS